MSKSSLSRLFGIVLAIVAWVGLVVQSIAITGKGLEFSFVFVNFFSYFTIQSNIFVALIATYWLFAKKETNNVYMRIFEFGTLVNITVTGIVYGVILAGIWQPQGLDLIADTLLHYVVPLLFVVNWFVFRRKIGWDNRIALTWLLYPLLYFVYSLIRGRVTSWYPYPFIDESILGLQQVLVNAVLMTLFFIAIGTVYAFIDNKLKK